MIRICSWSGRDRLLSLFVVGLLVAPVGAIPAFSSVCDPYAKDLDAAKAFIDSGNFAQAQTIVDRTLAKDPTDFRANYQKGQIIVSQADAADRVRFSRTSPFPSGIGLLVQTAVRLDGQDQQCAKKKNFYAILNTIGAEYLNRSKFSDAEKYLTIAYAKRDMLSRDTTIKLLDNLGLVYLLQNKFDQSTRYYQEAQAAGSTVAAYQLRTATQLRSVIKPVALPSRTLSVVRGVPTIK